jgi:hypothetical protein
MHGEQVFSHPVFFDRGHCADFDQRFKEQGKMTSFALPFRLSVADEVKAGWFKSNNQASTRQPPAHALRYAPGFGLAGQHFRFDC